MKLIETELQLLLVPNMRVWERDGSFYFQIDRNSYVNFLKTN